MDDTVNPFPPGGPHAPDIEENPRGADDRVAIRISSDNIAETATEVEDFVRALGFPLYRRGSLIVRAGMLADKLPDGSVQISLLSPHLSPAGLGDELSKAPLLNLTVGQKRMPCATRRSFCSNRFSREGRFSVFSH